MKKRTKIFVGIAILAVLLILISQGNDNNSNTLNKKDNNIINLKDDEAINLDNDDEAINLDDQEPIESNAMPIKYSGNPVLSSGPEGVWNYHKSDPAVIKDNGEYKMWYNTGSHNAEKNN